jgi:hypothetical protein
MIPLLTRALATFRAVSVEEQRCLDWFLHRSARKLPGAFISSFWTTALLQVAAAEPAVLHGALALSAAHEHDGCNVRPRSDVPDKKEQVMLRQYNKAIRHLLPLFSADRGTADQVALIACLLFVFLEYIRGHYMSGAMHLRNGIQLIRQRQRSSVTAVGAPCNELDDCILETFVRVQVSTALLEQDLCQLSLESLVSTPAIPGPIFQSIEQARLSLDLLLGRVLKLSEQWHHYGLDVPSQVDKDPSELCDAQRHIQTTLSSWFTTYKVSTSSLRGRLTPRETIAYELLSVYHTMATIMAATSCRTTESAFDSHLPGFVSIITQMINSWVTTVPRVQRLDEHLAHGPEMTASISDVGCIPPLYFTALKCRNHRVRTQAAKLINIVPHKEGIWDATLMSDVALEAISVEEGAFYKDLSPCRSDFDMLTLPTESDLLTPLLPEAQRMREFKVQLPTDPDSKLILTGSRRQNNGSVETASREYNTQTRSWTDVTGSTTTC